ncbi:MAG TPA: Swt1 family HEPN domain-containing protein [Longimicrobium sp.]|nr:Swt1 family HEPN domain-containing protein [Longimicrobium sp.]
MDVTQELRDTENALRDFIQSVLSREIGSDWVQATGVSAERIQRWRDRKETEEKRQVTGVVEERLLYYADFYDLKTILKKHWQRFSPALGEWKTVEVYLSELERLRDPDAHRRELLPHQKHLILGIGGEIRTRLVRFRSKQETMEDYFPRIESARDSLGNIWTPDADHITHVVHTNLVLRPGDQVDYVITATDPLGEDLEYAVKTQRYAAIDWQPTNSFRITVREDNIARSFAVELFVRSKRDFHATEFFDDSIDFIYTVLPPRT